jgi:alpha-tubulin suppressor-like RCC1 family protein
MTDVRQVRGSSSHVCALTGAGEVKCAGFCDEGELGDGKWGRPCVELVATTATGLEGAREVAVGGQYTCAIAADRSVYCWGMNGNGELGLGPSVQRQTTPAKVPGLESIVHITAAPSHACALRDDGAVFCWGDNAFGQLGTGDHVSRPTPSRVVGLPPT